METSKIPTTVRKVRGTNSTKNPWYESSMVRKVRHSSKNARVLRRQRGTMSWCRFAERRRSREATSEDVWCACQLWTRLYMKWHFAFAFRQIQPDCSVLQWKLYMVWSKTTTSIYS